MLDRFNLLAKPPLEANGSLSYLKGFNGAHTQNMIGLLSQLVMLCNVLMSQKY